MLSDCLQQRSQVFVQVVEDLEEAQESVVLLSVVGLDSLQFLCDDVDNLRSESGQLRQRAIDSVTLNHAEIGTSSLGIVRLNLTVLLNRTFNDVLQGVQLGNRDRLVGINDGFQDQFEKT
ncbi:hypothetical protein WICPIJ_002141 [Wickerhamomyces pijperi]|uniref:Uncharacterized protein n=1 Tax=Wickerhamomyces pijperi TaxID=599730 RepID=A0A9P8QC92_WICPI|nr:hypothetical protein WICPIJ_002141 [Wickerhamomyces pijperi]